MRHSFTSLTIPLVEPLRPWQWRKPPPRSLGPRHSVSSTAYHRSMGSLAFRPTSVDFAHLLFRAILACAIDRPHVIVVVAYFEIVIEGTIVEGAVDIALRTGGCCRSGRIQGKSSLKRLERCDDLRLPTCHSRGFDNRLPPILRPQCSPMPHCYRRRCRLRHYRWRR